VDETIAVEAHDDVELGNLGDVEKREGQELAHGFVSRGESLNIRRVAAEGTRISGAVFCTLVLLLPD
jgi:hypothetical protein